MSGLARRYTEVRRCNDLVTSRLNCDDLNLGKESDFRLISQKLFREFMLDIKGISDFLFN